jgi:hypothetical protein
MAAGPNGDDERRSTGMRWNKQTTPAQVNKSNGFNAFYVTTEDVPESDWDEFMDDASPAPKSRSPRPPTEEERCRGYVRGRSGG